MIPSDLQRFDGVHDGLDRKTCQQYARRTVRYASDMTDRQWAFVAPFPPMPRRLESPRADTVFDFGGGDILIVENILNDFLGDDILI
jgi:hypothetical protein